MGVAGGGILGLTGNFSQPGGLGPAVQTRGEAGVPGGALAASPEFLSSPGAPQIRIWGRPRAIAEGQGAYALNITGPILRFFEMHYNTLYPLSKSGR